MRHCTISIYVWLQFQIVNSKLMQLKIFDFFLHLKNTKVNVYYIQYHIQGLQSFLCQITHKVSVFMNTST